MKIFLLAAVLAGASAGALARDHAYDIKPGLPASVAIDGASEQRVRVRVGNAAPQEIARLNDEEVDYFETPDIDHDGYRDLVIGQSGGGGQVHARLFLFRPRQGGFHEIAHPAPSTSPCHQFINPVFDAGKAAFSTGCRYSADRYGTEDYALRPDGTARPLQWTARALFDLEDSTFDLTYAFHEDGAVARIQIDGEGAPLDGDGRVPFERIDLYDAPDVKALSTQAARGGDRLDVIALRPQWLQVRPAGAAADAPAKWVRYADLKIDKHRYAPPRRPPASGLMLSVYGHLGTTLYEAAGRFTLHVSNLGPGPVRLQSPRVWLLFIDAQDHRTLQPLYQRPPVTLAAPAAPAPAAPRPAYGAGADRVTPPAPAPHVAQWADEPVLWRQDEAGAFGYQVSAGNGQYAPFFPDLAPGRYRLVVALTDPAAATEPVYSNVIEVDLPFPKRQ